MKKIVCLHNVYHEGRFLSAGTDVGLPDDVASNWVERGLAKFVSEETPVNPPAVPPVEKPEVKPEEKAPVKYDFTTEIPKAEENAVIKDNLTTEKMAIEETPAAVDDTPKRGRPPKKKHGGKRK
ncbi:MAG: hypothetical protein II819_11540 [Fibrobacter sp.]|nr:hypothetical protein [Fibrobacter sp.]MBQ6770461.1 hypothetical protein [Bacteroidales bacterium]